MLLLYHVLVWELLVLSRRIQMFMLCSKVLSKEELDFRDIRGVLGVGSRVQDLE